MTSEELWDVFFLKETLLCKTSQLKRKGLTPPNIMLSNNNSITCVSVKKKL